MPCHSDYSDRDYSGDTRARQRQHERDVNTIDTLTRLLCASCKVMTGAQLEEVGNEVQYWWLEHQRLDASREHVA